MAWKGTEDPILNSTPHCIGKNTDTEKLNDLHSNHKLMKDLSLELIFASHIPMFFYFLMLLLKSLHPHLSLISV